MARYYRIVRDSYNGYEVQAWRWWWPFWRQCNFVNTHPSIERAELFAKTHADGSGVVVKHLGRLPNTAHPTADREG